MELTGLQIFKYLPAAKKNENTNCKKCGCATCMAFALKLAKKQVDIEKCPFVPSELKEKFDEVSKVQQNEIKLSNDLVAGGETVMYRHDKTFVNETIISVSLSCNDVDFLEKLEKIASYKIERIGQIFKVNAIYLDGDKESELYKKSMI
jgi:acetyl-CoA decarbonylase/synthase complex subunit gamma